MAKLSIKITARRAQRPQFIALATALMFALIAATVLARRARDARASIWHELGCWTRQALRPCRVCLRYTLIGALGWHVCSVMALSASLYLVRCRIVGNGVQVATCATMALRVVGVHGRMGRERARRIEPNPRPREVRWIPPHCRVGRIDEVDAAVQGLIKRQVDKAAVDGPPHPHRGRHNRRKARIVVAKHHAAKYGSVIDGKKIRLNIDEISTHEITDAGHWRQRAAQNQVRRAVWHRCRGWG